MDQSDSRPRALVTGITGFTGQYLKTELEHLGYQVFGTTQNEDLASPTVRHIDLRSASEVESLVHESQPEVVAHLAAVSNVAHGSVDEIYATNVVGTRSLLVALAQLDKSPTSVLLASSANIYGTAASGLDETAIPSPQNDYAVSKLAMEYAAQLWAEKLPITIVRPFNYTGVGQSENFLVPKLVRSFAQRQNQLELGNIEVSRDFSDVRTLVWAYGQLLSKPKPGEIFNVASGTSTSIKQILEFLSEVTNHTPRVVSIESLKRGNELQNLVGNAEKLWTTIGNPPVSTFEDTLRWMLGAAKP